MDNRVWVKDAVMTIRLPEEVDHFVADRLRAVSYTHLTLPTTPYV